MPPMMMIASAGAVLFVSRGFGLLGANPAVQAFNYAAVATWFVVGGGASLVMTWRGARNLSRLGVAASVRPRWWFEVARVAWITSLFALLGSVLLTFGAGARFVAVAAGLFRLAGYLVTAFFVTTTWGYVLSALTRHRRRGRAFECVQYFYITFGVVGGVTQLVVWLPNRLGWANDAITVTACVAAAVVMGVLILAISERARKRADME